MESELPVVLGLSSGLKRGFGATAVGYSGEDEGETRNEQDNKNTEIGYLYSALHGNGLVIGMNHPSQ